MNNVALVDGQPRTLGLREMLSVWVDHRIDVVRRRSAYRLRKRSERLHLVDGLLVAIVDIDEVIQVIRSSDDTATARGRLQTVFDLSEPQAEYILELQLRRLTKFSRIELEKEQETLRREIEELQEILGSDARLRAVVSGEMADVAKTYGTPRRTILLESAGAAPTTTSAVPLRGRRHHVLGAVLRDRAARPHERRDGARALGTARRARRAARRGPHDRARRGRPRHEPGPHAARLRARPARAPPTDNAPSLSGGVPLSEVVALEPGEDAVTIASLDPTLPARARHRAGRRQARHPGDVPGNRDEWEVMGLKDGDTVVGAAPATDADELVFVSSDASLLHFDASAVRPQGRPAGGMAGIRLADGQRVAFFGVVPADVRDLGVVVTVAGRPTRSPGPRPAPAR